MKHLFPLSILFIGILAMNSCDKTEPEPPLPINAYMEMQGMFISNQGDTIYNDSIAATRESVFMQAQKNEGWFLYQDSNWNYVWTQYPPHYYVYIPADRFWTAKSKGYDPALGGWNTFGELPLGRFWFVITPEYDSAGLEGFNSGLIGRTISLGTGKYVDNDFDFNPPTQTWVLTPEGRLSMILEEKKGINGRFWKYEDYPDDNLWELLDSNARAEITFTGFSNVQRDGHEFKGLEFTFLVENVKNVNHPNTVGRLEGRVYSEFYERPTPSGRGPN